MNPRIKCKYFPHSHTGPIGIGPMMHYAGFSCFSFLIKIQSIDKFGCTCSTCKPTINIQVVGNNYYFFLSKIRFSASHLAAFCAEYCKLGSTADCIIYRHPASHTLTPPRHTQRLKLVSVIDPRHYHSNIVLSVVNMSSQK